jgi:ribosome-binding protein aMBF1 (putative translation factor)
MLRSSKVKAMGTRRKTGFDTILDQQLESPSFAKSYQEARTEVDVIDEIVRALDAAREKAGFSKAELAALSEARPEVIRRLFTAKNPNPTLSTLVRLASALGYRVALVRDPPRRAARRRTQAA